VDTRSEPINWVKLTKDLPNIAEPVFVIGSPRGLEQTVSEGIVSAVRDLPEKGQMIQITAPISPGSSGSPVVNMKKEVMGVATLYLVGGQNLNFAVPSKHVIALKKEQTAKTISEWTTGNIKMAEKWVEKGGTFFKPSDSGGSYEEAIRCYTKALELNPLLAKAYYYRAIAWYNKKEPDRSIADFTKLLELESDYNAIAYVFRAEIWETKANFDQAISDYTKAIEVRPGDSKIYISRAKAWAKKGEFIWRKTESAYKEGTADFNQIINADAHLTTNYERALDDYKKALSLDPANRSLQDLVSSLEITVKKMKKQMSATVVED
jgi:tetratricopeptide (TPR) repeat protein